MLTTSYGTAATAGAACGVGTECGEGKNGSHETSNYRPRASGRAGAADSLRSPGVAARLRLAGARASLALARKDVPVSGSSRLPRASAAERAIPARRTCPPSGLSAWHAACSGYARSAICESPCYSSARSLSYCLHVVVGNARIGSGGGVRGGVSVDPDQFYFGGHYETGPLVDRLHFKPNIEAGFGDDLTLIAINFEFVYKFPSKGPWNLYAGGGPAINFFSFDNVDDSETASRASTSWSAPSRGAACSSR